MIGMTEPFPCYSLCLAQPLSLTGECLRKRSLLLTENFIPIHLGKKIINIQQTTQNKVFLTVSQTIVHSWGWHSQQH